MHERALMADLVRKVLAVAEAEGAGSVRTIRCASGRCPTSPRANSSARRLLARHDRGGSGRADAKTRAHRRGRAGRPARVGRGQRLAPVRKPRGRARSPTDPKDTAVSEPSPTEPDVPPPNIPEPAPSPDVPEPAPSPDPVPSPQTPPGQPDPGPGRRRRPPSRGRLSRRGRGPGRASSGEGE